MPKIELYPHNQAALNHLEEALKYTRRAAVIQPTGTGKSFVALAFIERRPNNSFLYLAPSTHNTKRIDYCAPHSTGIPLGCIVLCVRVYQQTGEKRVLLVNFSPISSQVKRLMCFDDNAPTGERP